MTTAVLSLGSNMGDSRALLADAVRGLGPAVRAVSSVYRTPPWGPVPQDDFLNLVVIASDDTADAMAWWRRCQRLERDARRERLVRWGPRTLDVDVVAVTEQRGGRETPVLCDHPELTLPHPRAAQRAFVLVPWAEIDPAAELPGHGPVAELIAGLDTTGIQRIGRVTD